MDLKEISRMKPEECWMRRMIERGVPKNEEVENAKGAEDNVDRVKGYMTPKQLYRLLISWR